jgi:hypothetical protein
MGNCCFRDQPSQAGSTKNTKSGSAGATGSLGADKPGAITTSGSAGSTSPRDYFIPSETFGLKRTSTVRKPL